MLSSIQAGVVEAGDCVFQPDGANRTEDLYLVNQGRLGVSDLSGGTMLTFTADAEFAAMYGIGGFSGREIFPTPVYGYSRFPEWGDSFSFIGDAPMYRLWFGGLAPGEEGAYTLTTVAEPSVNSCEVGHTVFIQGDVELGSTLSDGNACEGTVAFGPNAGSPLIYQYWQYKLLEGETLTVTATGLVPDPTIVLALINFYNGDSVLDFESAPGDMDRTASYTAPFDMYLYVVVSSAPGVLSPYTLTVDAP